MTMLDSINTFVDTMVAEKATFEKLQSEITTTQNNVQEIVADLETGVVRSATQLSDSDVMKNDPAVREIFNAVSQVIQESAKKANNDIQETVKGMTFIRAFEKRFTVAVFGKVKAGKSYIGNFIMGNSLKEYGISSSYDPLRPLTVTVYDRGNSTTQEELSTIEEKETAGESFAVGMTETTSTIQWFEIGGLSWFDTPGIGSVTWENEMLAKEYVKNSDLVIYACNSDAAGTRQDFTEMKQLLAMKKPILLLLTQSDVTDEDVDENGDIISVFVPKSDKDRHDMEQYMLDTIREQGMTDILKYANVLTVSAKLANIALKTNDEKLYEASNMSKLLDKLTEITKSSAAELKRNTPKDRINKLIDDTIKTVHNVAVSVDEQCQKIAENEKALIERKEAILESIRNDVSRQILVMLDKYKNEIDKNGGTIDESQIIDAIADILNNTISAVCQNELKVAVNDALQYNISGIGSMQMKKDSIAYEVKEVVQVRRDAKGVFEKFGEFFLDKKYYTNEVRTRTRYSEFNVGINNNELAASITLQLNEIFSKQISNMINSLVVGYYKPVAVLRQSVIDLTNDSIARLEKTRM